MADTPVTRQEFELLCKVVEIILAVPGGVNDLSDVLSWQGRETMIEFAKARMPEEG